MSINSMIPVNTFPFMNINSFIIINKWKYLFSPVSSLKSQLHSPITGSLIKSLFEFYSDAAIPPKKQFGSSALCIITRVEPDNHIIKIKKIPFLLQSEWNVVQLNLYANKKKIKGTD